MRLSVLLSVTAAAGSASALPKPGELECALRVLAFNFSQTLLPEGGAVQDAEVAAALRLGSDCGVYELGATEQQARELAPAAAESSCVLHVATTGSDSAGTGTEAAPFASLAAAQRALPTTRTSTAEYCTVLVQTGTYYLGSTLELGPAESNTAWQPVPGADVTLSGGIPIPAASFQPSSAGPKILAADVSALNLTTITPLGSGGPANRLFVDDAPMTWARYPDAPPNLPECALKIPLGRVGLSDPPRVGFVPDEANPTWQPAVVAKHSWMIPTVGPQAGAHYAKESEHVTHYPNWSTPEMNGGAARPGWEKAPLMNSGGMSPCYVDAVGGPFARFTPPVGHGPYRTRTVTVAPVGVVVADGEEFSPRMKNWSEPQWGVVQSMHWCGTAACLHSSSAAASRTTGRPFPSSPPLFLFVVPPCESFKWFCS